MMDQFETYQQDIESCNCIPHDSSQQKPHCGKNTSQSRSPGYEPEEGKIDIHHPLSSTLRHK
jgi:hypothetical protein